MSARYWPRLFQIYGPMHLLADSSTQAFHILLAGAAQVYILGFPHGHDSGRRGNHGGPGSDACSVREVDLDHQRVRIRVTSL